MIDGYYLLGKPKPFKDICKIYAPTINDVYDNPKFFAYIGLLLMDQDELNKKYQEQTHIPSVLEVLLSTCNESNDGFTLITSALQFFIHEPVLPLFKTGAFLIGDPKVLNDGATPRLLTEENFFEFQNEIALSVAHDPLEYIDKDEDMDPRLRKMKQKRKEAKKVKAKQMQKKGEGATLEQNLVAIFCMGGGITPLNIGEMTYASVMNIISGYQTKESYDTTIRAMTSGFGSKKTKTPKYWMTQL